MPATVLPSHLPIAADVPLAPLTTLRIGGRARFYATPSSARATVACLHWAKDNGLRVWLLGGGSNVVIADAGLDGLVIRPSDESIRFVESESMVTVTAGAGVQWDALVAVCVARDLAGIECLSGIPGLCGAAPMQNIGAYGQQLSDTAVAVTVLNTATLSARTWTAQECAFAYRDSALKRAPAGSLVVLSIQLALRRGGAATIRYPDVQELVGEGSSLASVREAVIAVRKRKGMVICEDDPDSRSAGSFFVNPIVSPEHAERAQQKLAADAMPQWPADGGVKLSAAWLIERSGLHKGYGNGRVGLSSKHTLALVNRGGCTAVELLEFARHVQDRVLAASGIALVMEPRCLGV